MHYRRAATTILPLLLLPVHARAAPPDGQIAPTDGLHDAVELAGRNAPPSPRPATDNVREAEIVTPAADDALPDAGKITADNFTVSTNLTEPAFFLGVGIAAGLEEHLNLTTATSTNTAADHQKRDSGNTETDVTETFAASASGVNAVAETIGRAVSSFLFLTVNAANGPVTGTRTADPALTDLDNATANSVVGSLAQNVINGLTCEAVGGITALVRDSKIGFPGLDAGIISEANLSDLSFTLTSGGAQFAVDLADQSVRVNGYSWTMMLILTLVHVGCMTLAFFVVFPSIIIIESLGIIHNIVGLGWNEPRTTRWLNLCELLLYPTLIAGGLATSVAAVGSSPHFSTTHGRYGLATIVLAFMCSGLSAWRRRWHPSTSISSPETVTNIRRQPVVFFSGLFTQAVLIVSSVLPINGMDDFNAVTLCQYLDLPAATVITAVEYAVALWFAAFAFMSIEFWLLWRLGKLKRPRKKPQGNGNDIDISWPLESDSGRQLLRRN